MQLSVGIVGLPNVGKSTLFNALTKNAVPAENYPFCTIDPSVGIVAVPDERLVTLARLSQSRETIPAVVEFVDIAGLVRGAASGEGLGNQFLSHIRETDMIAQVVRIFEDKQVHHVHGAVEPMSDIEAVNLELVLADQEAVARRLSGLEKELKRGAQAAREEQAVLQKIAHTLEAGQMARTASLSKEEAAIARTLHLLTMKPMLYVCNKKHDAYNLDEHNDERWQELLRFFEASGAEHVLVDAGVEAELSELSEEEKVSFRREYGTLAAGIDGLIRGAYELLGLMSFFTTGVKETRAWTIRKSSTAPEAGAAVHTDFKERFIRAQVVSFEDFVAAGSLAAARRQGVLRTEGKGYVVRNGDIIEFLI